MRTSNGVRNIRTNHLSWYLLAEYALNEMMPDEGEEYELIVGFLFQPFQRLSVPLELINQIERTLKEIAQQSRLERPRSFRVFCQKKVIEGANITNTYRPDHVELTMESAHSKDPSGTILTKGWGYFIVERSGVSHDTLDKSPSFFDLYLYKEGK